MRGGPLELGALLSEMDSVGVEVGSGARVAIAIEPAMEERHPRPTG